jgi:signal transduction histidine kinase/ActR/RegA family two-component response regulator
MSAPHSSRFWPKISLQTILVWPFVVQIVCVVSLVGYLSFQNGQQAVNEVAEHLQEEISARIEDYLHGFLAPPHQINQFNAEMLGKNLLSAQHQLSLQQYFYHQIKNFPQATSIYFGNPAGGIVGSGREGEDGLSLYFTGTENFTAGTFQKTAASNQGTPGEVLTTVPNFDARLRPWYTGAVTKGQATWSEVYILFTGQDMAIAASRPVFNTQNELLGVVSIDIFLSHLSQFLASLEIGQNGQTFIIERSGLLVASSTGESPFSPPDANGQRHRLLASESTHPLVQQTAVFLSQEWPTYQNITQPIHTLFSAAGEQYFLHLSPLQDEYGINWLIVVVIPEQDFMAQIQRNNQMTLLLIVLSLVVTVIIGWFTARLITRPVLNLKRSTQALAQGEWEEIVTPNWIIELDELTHAFNHMGGQLRQTLQNLTTEIQERQRAEEEKGRLFQQMQQQAQRVQQIINTVPEGVLLCDQTGRVLLANPLGEQDLATLSNAKIGETLTHLAGTPWADLLAPPPKGLWHELHHDSRVFELIARFIQTTPHNEGWVLVIRDVTHQRQVERHVHHQERLASLGQLAGGIAHDFNNVLVPIIGYAELGGMNSPAGSKLHTYLNQIIKAAKQAASLTQQILAFSRRQILEMTVLDLNDIITGMTPLLERLIGENIAILTHLNPTPCLVKVDKTQIEQILLNLTVNARDAMPNGGKLTVETSLVYLDQTYVAKYPEVQVGHYVMLAISDNGQGMSAETRAHIFEPFFTTKERGRGSGLGLATVFGIVKQHQGHIGVYSELGRGTTFKIYIPETNATPHPAEETTSDMSNLYGQETILVTEDEEMVRQFVVETLQAYGYQLLEASTVQYSLELAMSHPTPIDLLLTDVIMPQLNGPELYQTLLPHQPQLKVLYMSGYTDNVIIHQGVLDEGVNFLQKPFTVYALVHKVRELLNQTSSLPPAGA